MRPLVRLLSASGACAALLIAVFYWFFAYPRVLDINVSGRASLAAATFTAQIHNPSGYRIKSLLVGMGIQDNAGSGEQDPSRKFMALVVYRKGPYRCDVDLLPHRVGECKFNVEFDVTKDWADWSVLEVRGVNALPWD